MKQFKFLTIAAAALALGFSSCSNDDDMGGGNTEIKKGEQTAMGLTITAPRAPQTYASTDPNATNDEIVLNKVNVLIYAETATPGSYVLEDNKQLVMSDFDPVSGTPDTYTLKQASKITTTTGNKKIYVAMNYPGTFPAINSPLSALSSLSYTLPSADGLSLPANGLAMFSTLSKDATLVVEATPGVTPPANIVTISVKRMVAKITVQETAALRSGGKIMSQGGELTNLQFSIGHANKTTYALQNRVGVSPNIVVQDMNWSSYVAGDFFGINSYALTSTDYFTVDNTAATALTAKAVYAPENTAQTYNVDGDNLTYISVRAQYAPEFFVDATGTSKGLNNVAKTFWTVVKTDGSILYFDVEADATTYEAANAGSVKSPVYQDGICYFRAYINKTGKADGNIAGSVAAKFDVLRNNYYKATISSIKAPGKPIDEGKVTEETTLLVNVEVEPWFAVTDDHELQ